MMSKLKSRLIGSSNSLVLAFALLALSFAFGAVQAHAEETVTISCSLPTDVMDATVAEELDVLCQAQAAATEVITAEADVRPSIGSDPSVDAIADASTPSATEGQAIRVEITQTVTVATLGQELAASDESDVTGTVASESTADDLVSKAEPVALYQLE
jgi:hypothetical protein